jgi:thiol:disulfide interchange protein DsbG
MRNVFFLTAMFVAPGICAADESLQAPKCALGFPRSVKVAANSDAAATGQSARPSAPVEAAKTTPNPDPVEGLPSVAQDIDQVPVLKHVSETGAKIFDLGTSHGLRGVIARLGEEFMLLEVAPDGQAVVAGLQTDLSMSKLLAIAGGQVTELGSAHGLRGVFVRDGAGFQVFYATPDGERLIPGVMWDAVGKNLTREQVGPIAGTVPTVVIGNNDDITPDTLRGVKSSPLDLVKETSFGVTGSASAPRLWMFVDPLCSYSVRALQEIQPLVARGRVQVAVIPVSVLDYEDNGMSTPSALALVSKPADQMIAAWAHGDLKGPAGTDAESRLRVNMAASEAIGLRGTPTVIWRKADGSEGRIDGLPGDWNAVIASMGGESHAK